MTCQLCPLSLPHQVVGVGPLRPKLIVIGEFPSGDDEKSKVPFTGGKDPKREYPNLIIRRALANMLKLDVASEVYLTYALRCNVKHRSKQVTEVKPAWVKTCRVANLEPELAKIHCPLILVLGKEAFNSLLPELSGGLAKHRRRWHEVTLGGQRRLVLPTFSLGQVERQSLWLTREDDDGQHHRVKRWPAFGSVGWHFNKDLMSVKEKLFELGLVPHALKGTRP